LFLRSRINPRRGVRKPLSEVDGRLKIPARAGIFNGGAEEAIMNFLKEENLLICCF